MLAIILAVAGVRLRLLSERTSVMFVLDQSESIDNELRKRMYEYARMSVNEHRDQAREDLAGVIMFGADAAIEVAPFDADLPIDAGVDRVSLRTDGTDLEEAITLAASSMPPDTRRRIVVFTDGNQTEGRSSA
ncbi:MAG: VWA domain-containing protein [Pirellulaceae bacterium]